MVDRLAFKTNSRHWASIAMLLLFPATDLVAADCNHNGIPDDQDVSTSLLKFDLPARIGTEPKTMAVSAADFDGDALPDLAAMVREPGEIILFINSDQGLVEKSTFPFEGTPLLPLFTGDLDGDGRLDLAFNNEQFGISFLLNTGGGSFTEVRHDPSMADYGFIRALGDFDNDGDLDLLTNTWMLSNNGNGTFTPTTQLNLGGWARPACTADFNGDGAIDLALYQPELGDNTVSVYLSEGDGTFTAAKTYPVGFEPRSIVADDLNGDGQPDLAFTPGGPIGVSVLLNLGDGTGRFGAAKTIKEDLFSPISIAAADFNLDGLKDLVTANVEHSVSVFLNLGIGQFGSPVVVNLDEGVVSDLKQVISADLDAMPVNEP